jgi:two-component sensor histidine kinase
VWTGIGVVLVAQTFATVPLDTPRGDDKSMVAVWFIYLQMMRAWLWGLLTPLVFELRRRVPFRGWWIPLGLFLHFAFCAVLLEWVMVTRIWIWAALPLRGTWSMPFVSLQELTAQFGPRQLLDVLAYLGTLGAGYIVDLLHERQRALIRENALRLKLSTTELQQEQLRSELMQAEMKALKQQLHPHFLFNALNAVSGLVRLGENAQAVEALARVSSLLRALIGSTGRPVVKLEEELTYCRTYLEIEKMRFDARLSFSIDAAPDSLAAEVPTLLLQPMVENAIKHGIARRRTPGEVRIRTWAEGERLLLEVVNDPAELPRGAASPPSHGVGLTTTRQRLERAFGTEFVLDCRVNPPAGTVLRIELPLKIAESAVPVRAATTVGARLVE